MVSSSNRRKNNSYVPLPTISRDEFVSGGTDERFRDIVYAMVAGLDILIACRTLFGKLVGVTGSQFAVLFGVAYRQGTEGVTIRQLADHVRLAQPHVTTEVGRLIRAGFLVKKPHPLDRRSVLVLLSERGRAAVAQLSPTIRQTNDRLFADIASAELEQVGRVMKILATNAEAALVELNHRQAVSASRRLQERGGSPGRRRPTSRAARAL
jgi:DNA-binding MarR family transcriptional regulator